MSDTYKKIGNIQRSCQFCSKDAKVFHSACNRYVCDYYGCAGHIRSCHQSSSYNRSGSCHMCVNGRIITGYNTSTKCYLCYGNE